MLLLRVWLFGAAVPAIGMGIWLLRIADAPRSAQAVQVVTVAAAMAVHAAMVWWRVPRSVSTNKWLSMLLIGGLFLPLSVGSHNGPARWLPIGNFRLYLAPLLLPLTLFQLGAPRQGLSAYTVSVIAVAFALSLQPDASQLTAFAVAMTALLASGDRPRLVRVSLLSLVLGAAGVAWRTPETLAPVRYVEGAFAVAAAVSPWGLGLALVAALLPVATFAWAARILSSPGAFAVALYWAAVFALAPRQVTPVPWLGFGAGPILGYFLVAGAVSRAVAEPNGRPNHRWQPTAAEAMMSRRG